MLLHPLSLDVKTEIESTFWVGLFSPPPPNYPCKFSFKEIAPGDAAAPSEPPKLQWLREQPLQKVPWWLRAHMLLTVTRIRQTIWKTPPLPQGH